MAEFDRQYQETRLDDYRATVEQGERNLKKVDVELEVSRQAHDFSIQQARSSVDKAKLDIKTVPVRSQIEAEFYRLQLEEAEAQLKQLLSEVPHKRESERSQRRSSELDLAESRKELQQAERNVSRMLINSPMDGMVVMQNIFRGGEFTQIKEGDQLFPGQMFMQVVDPSSMLVQATVNQADVEHVRVGAKAHLRFDAYPGLVLPGKVLSIGAMTRPGGQRASFVKEIPVFIKIEKLDPRVIPDMSVSADVVIASKDDQVIAPMESVFRDAPDAKPYVYVRTAKGFEKREVELGLFNYVKASIVSGLKAGEVIAVEPPAKEQPDKQSAGSRGVNNV